MTPSSEQNNIYEDPCLFSTVSKIHTNIQFLVSACIIAANNGFYISTMNLANYFFNSAYNKKIPLREQGNKMNITAI